MNATTDAVTLTDRYIGAVVRTVPERQRDDVARELRASIQDELDARRDAGEDRHEAERATLTELGDPDALAAGYADRPLHLIGPRYYLTWWRLLKLLLWIVVPSAAGAIALGLSLAGEPIGAVIGGTIGIGLSVAVHLCFWVTLVFALVERSGGDVSGTEWSLDSLPEPRERGLGVGDLVASLVLLALAAAAVVWDGLVGVVWLGGGWMPFLDPALWPWWAAALLALLALDALLVIVVFVRRGWTVPLAIVNAALDVVAISLFLTLLGRGLLVNGEVLDLLTAQGAEGLHRTVPIILGFVVVGIAVWDAIDAFLKARRTSRRR